MEALGPKRAANLPTRNIRNRVVADLHIQIGKLENDHLCLRLKWKITDDNFFLAIMETCENTVENGFFGFILLCNKNVNLLIQQKLSRNHRLAALLGPNFIRGGIGEGLMDFTDYRLSKLSLSWFSGRQGKTFILEVYH